MDWDNLQYFLAVARQGSLSAAAKQLGVNHSTVSRRLDRLEQQLQVRLFDRLPQGYRLTESGQGLWQQALQIEEQLHQISRRFRGSEHQLSGSLKVSKPSAGILNLAPMLHAFQQEYGSITVDLSASTAFSDLNRMEAEVAIRMTDQPPLELVGRKLGLYPLYVYASRRYLETLPQPVDPEQCDWVIWHEEGSEVDMEQLVKTYLPNARIVLRTSCYTELYEAVVAGMGASLLSPLRLPVDHQLIAISPERFQYHRELWLLTHPDLRDSARVKAFMRFAVDYWQPRLQPAPLSNIS